MFKKDKVIDEWEDDEFDENERQKKDEDNSILSNAIIGGVIATGILVAAFAFIACIAYFGVSMLKKTSALIRK